MVFRFLRRIMAQQEALKLLLQMDKVGREEEEQSGTTAVVEQVHLSQKH